MVPLEKLLALLPGHLLERLARVHQVDKKNQVRLPGSCVFVCLLNALVNHEIVTQRLLADLYRQRTGRSADHSSFGRRLCGICPDYFAAIFGHLYQRMAPSLSPGEARVLGLTPLRLRFVDATIVTLSSKLLSFGIEVGASRRAALGESKRQVKAVFELSGEGLPALLRLCQEQSESSDDVALGASMTQHSQPGDLFVFDRGCRAVARLLALHEAGAFFLTPHRDQGLQSLCLVWQAPQWQTPQSPVAPPAPAVEAPVKDEADSFRLLRVERVLFTGGRDKEAKKRLPGMEMLALHGERWDKRTRAWKPMTLLSNLPLSPEGERGGDKAGPFTFLEVAQLYKRRWQIEIFFRFLKQHLGYRHLTSRSQNGITVMIYMSLIAALLLTWYQRLARVEGGWRSVKFWFAEEAREWTRLVLEKALGPPEVGVLPAQA